MQWFADFTATYADGITAMATIGAVAMAGLTLWYVKKEYESKYRPYVFAGVSAEKIVDGKICSLIIIPKNFGSHPCQADFLDIVLTIGDEPHTTPNVHGLMLAPQAKDIGIPAGHVNEIGITRIREGRYKKNRVELAFTIQSSSMDGRFGTRKRFQYEVDVTGEKPQALLRTDWIKDV